MKFKRKIKTNVILSFVITLLVLSVIDLSFVPQTNSRYKTAETTKLQYTASLVQLYREGATYTYQLPKPTPDLNPELTADKDNKTFDIEFSFLRQNASAVSDVNDTNLDIYTITAPDNCTVNGKKEDIVSFNYPSKVDEEVSVTLHCDANAVPPENGQLELNVSVQEQVGSEKAFNYTDYSFIIKEDYYNDVMEIVKWENPLVVNMDEIREDKNELYKQFTEWVAYYAKKSEYETIVNKYLYNTEFESGKCTGLSNANTLINNSICWNKIPGLKMEYDEILNTYTYTIEENLLGFSRTKNASNKNHMYFYVSKYTDEEISTIFEYYLKDSMLFSSDDILSINEYLSRRGGISAAISGKSVLGMFYDSVDHHLLLGSNFMDYVESLKYKEDEISLNFETYRSMQIRFREQLAQKYSDLLSQNLQIETAENRLFKELKEKDSLIFERNSVDSTDMTSINNPGSYINYYAIWDGEDSEHKNYIIVKAYSEVEKYPDNEIYKKNNFNLSKLVVPAVDSNKIYPDGTTSFPQSDFMTVVFTNDSSNPDLLTIRLVINNRTTDQARSEIVDNLLVTLTKYFEENHGKINSYTLTENQNVANQWIAVIKVSKNYAYYKGTASEEVANESNASLVEDTNNNEDLSVLESVQERIDNATNAAASAAEEMKESDEVEDVPVSDEENKGLAMISSIMKFLLVKE